MCNQNHNRTVEGTSATPTYVAASANNTEANPGQALHTSHQEIPHYFPSTPQKLSTAATDDSRYTELLNQLANYDFSYLPHIDLAPQHVHQPIHTVYMPAQTVSGVEVLEQWAKQAQQACTQHSEFLRTLDCCAYASRVELDALMHRTYTQLGTRAIGDLRIDFEDGFSQQDIPAAQRSEHEDQWAAHAGAVLAKILVTTDIRVGIRIKPLEVATAERSLRTLALVLNSMVHALANASDELVSAAADAPYAAGAVGWKQAVRQRFRVTLPKISHPCQMELLVQALSHYEQVIGLPSIAVEAQIELPHALVDLDSGVNALAPIVRSGAGRVAALHYGTYDYSASLGVDPQFQSMQHPVADHAIAMMQQVAHASGIELSHGSTNIIAQGPPETMQAAWHNHAQLITRAFEGGIRQGWDLHPSHLVTRQLATLAYYRQYLPTYATRLHQAFSESSEEILEEPATVRPLAAFVLRALAVGASDMNELSAYGFSHSQLEQLAQMGKEVS
ncbi:MAG: hypothetical protein Q3976_00550 [Corynebacterium sp.]|nr:hypothetical protein [Corynebacterium sp.]